MKWMVMVCFSVVATLTYSQQTSQKNLEQMKTEKGGVKVLEFLEVINSDEEPQMPQVSKLFSKPLIDNAGSEKLLESLKTMRNTDGGMDLYQAVLNKKGNYELKVKGVVSGEWADLIIYLEKSDDPKIAGFTIDSSDQPPKNIEPIYPEQR